MQGTTGNHRGTEAQRQMLWLSLCLCVSVVQSHCFGETVTIALLKNLSIRSLFLLHRGLRTVSFIQSVRIHPDI